MAAEPSVDAALFDLAEYRAAAIDRQYRTALLALEIAEDELEMKFAEYRRLEANLNELKGCLLFIRGISRPEVKR